MVLVVSVSPSHNMKADPNQTDGSKTKMRKVGDVSMKSLGFWMKLLTKMKNRNFIKTKKFLKNPFVQSKLNEF